MMPWKSKARNYSMGYLKQVIQCKLPRRNYSFHANQPREGLLRDSTWDAPREMQVTKTLKKNEIVLF